MASLPHGLPADIASRVRELEEELSDGKLTVLFERECRSCLPLAVTWRGSEFGLLDTH